MESLARVRTSISEVKRVGVPQLTASGPVDSAAGVLETLSPEMARELGEAFSLESIGRRTPRRRDDDRGDLGALRLASRVAAFVLVTAVAVTVTVGALYLMRLP